MRPKKKILLLDEDEVALGVMRFLFETHGFAVRGVSDFAAAYEEARVWRPAVLAANWDGSVVLKFAALFTAVRRAVAGVKVLVLAPEIERGDLGLEMSADFVLWRGQCAPALVIEAAKHLSARKRGPRKGSARVNAGASVSVGPALNVDDLRWAIARRAPASEAVIWAQKARVA